MVVEPSDVIHAFLEELTHTHMNIYTSKLNRYLMIQENTVL